MNRRSDYRDDERFKRTAAIQKRRYRQRTGSGYGRHKWTQHEKDLVLAHLIPDRELAVRLKVSIQAIQGKRSQLKRS